MIQEWCKINKLLLNISKCNIVSYHKKVNYICYSYNLSETLITRLQEVKDLGVIFDASLSFSSHINLVRSSALRMWGFIKRICADFKNINIYKTLYYALVRSRLEYASLTWCPFYKKDITLIERVQRRYLKFVYLKINGNYPGHNLPYSVLLNCTGDQSLYIRRKLFGLKFVHGIINSNINVKYLLSALNLTVPVAGIRRSNLFTLSTPRTNELVRLPIYRICTDYNFIASDCDIFFQSITTIWNMYLSFCKSKDLIPMGNILSCNWI